MAEEPKLYGGHFKLALDYVIGLGEAIVLAVFFRVAADQTHDIFVEALAFLMILAVGAYAGMPIGILMLPLHRIKTKKLWLALLITTPLAVGMVIVANHIGQEVSGVVGQLAKGALSHG
jgi:hypothetical protein